jgi:hypothetical protein
MTEPTTPRKEWIYFIDAQSIVETSVDNPELARFTLQIVPLPNEDELLKELHTELTATLNAFLTKHKITNGIAEDLTAGEAAAKPPGVTLQ